MSTDDSLGTSSQCQRLACRCRYVVDSIHHDALRWSSQAHGGVAQQRVLQLVLCTVGGIHWCTIVAVASEDARLYQLILGLAHRLADGHHQSLVITLQYLSGKGQVHQFIIGLVHGTRGSEERHSTAFPIKKSRFTDIVFLTVEGHDVARCRQP